MPDGYRSLPRRALGRAARDYRGAVLAYQQRRADQRMRRMLDGRFTIELLAGEVHEEDLAVVVCLWNRRERLADVIRLLRDQRVDRHLRLVLWNNQPDDEAHYRRVIAEVGVGGALRSIEFRASPENIGGIGRFWAARKLRLAGYRGPFVMLDDDQDVEPDFIRSLLERAGERVIAGVWAYANHGSYWNRTDLADRERADYVGTGGCVCDSEIVTDDAFFTDLPERYRFLEDIWMSFLAARLGWRLEKADLPVTFVLDETNQNHTLAYIKDEFYAYLHHDHAGPTDA